MELEFRGHGVEELGIETATGKTRVKINPRYFRPTEVVLLIGDYSKAKATFGWEPKVRFSELVGIMTEADWKRARRERQLA
jgi:GDPmannose 4,6-dehydratase